MYKFIITGNNRSVVKVVEKNISKSLLVYDQNTTIEELFKFFYDGLFNDHENNIADVQLHLYPVFTQKKRYPYVEMSLRVEDRFGRFDKTYYEDPIVEGLASNNTSPSYNLFLRYGDVMLGDTKTTDTGDLEIVYYAIQTPYIPQAIKDGLLTEEDLEEKDQDGTCPAYEIEC